MRPALARVAGWFALGSFCAIGLIGLAHTPWGKPLLMLMPGAVGCPVQDLSAEELEARRIAWGRARAGSLPSQARPALDFELGVTRKSDVENWLGARRDDCHGARHETALECKLPHDVYFQFDGQGRLVAVDVIRAPASAEEALRLLGDVERGLSSKIGSATNSRGERSAAFLGSAPYRQLSLEYRYTDYVGRVAATNLGSLGLRVREQYQWFPAKPGA
jgi:hypothetical protein